MKIGGGGGGRGGGVGDLGLFLLKKEKSGTLKLVSSKRGPQEAELRTAVV